MIFPHHAKSNQQCFRLNRFSPRSSFGRVSTGHGRQRWHGSNCPCHDDSSRSALRSSPRLRTAPCLGSQAFSFSGVENTGEEKEQDVSFVIQIAAPHQVVLQNFAGGPDLRPYLGPSGLPNDHLALCARGALLRRA